MKSYSEFIAAGQPVKMTIGGKLLYIQRSQAGAVLDITFHNGNGTQGVSGVGKGFKASPVGGFDTITFKAAADGVVEFIITDGEVSAQFDDASTLIGNDDGQAIPIRLPDGQRLLVDLEAGTVNVNATNVGINNDDTKPVPTKQKLAGIVTPYNPVNINAAGVLLFAQDLSRRGLRIRNVGANAVAIGGEGVTFDHATDIIQPGETWNENEAPGAEWHAICAAGMASTINLSVVS